MKTIMSGLDLAKSVFQVHGVDDAGQVMVRRRLRRGQVLGFFAKLAPAVVGLEACGGAHYWARQLSALGHEIRMMSPAYVKPYVKRNKTDGRDAEAICEAMQRPTMRFVAVKGEDQQAVMTVHRTRALLVRQRTMAGNALRSAFAEFGVVAAQGINCAPCWRNCRRRPAFRRKLTPPWQCWRGSGKHSMLISAPWSWPSCGPRAATSKAAGSCTFPVSARSRPVR